MFVWEKWYKKLKGLFGEEEEVQQENEQEPGKKSKPGYSNLQAKTVYQYPENKSFRFPVIPDEEKLQTSGRPRKKPEPPRYKQPEKKEGKQEDKHERNYTESENFFSSPKEKQKMERKIYKKDPEVPFEPSDVPSPIYGYRKDKDLASVPTFVRKKEDRKEVQEEKTPENELLHTGEGFSPEEQELDQDNEIHSLLRSSRQIPESAQDNEEEEIIDEDPRDVEEEIIEEDSQDVEEEIIQEDHHQDSYTSSYEEMDPTAGTDQSQRLTEDEMGIKKEEAEKKQQTRGEEKLSPAPTLKAGEDKRAENSSADRPNSTTPFNVIMTPRDKKRQFDRERKAEQERRKAEIRRSQDRQKQQITSIPYHLLDDPVLKSNEDAKWVEEQQRLLEQTLIHFNVKAKVVNATQGPSVTRFEVQPELGVKVSKVKNLSDDLKLNMSARDIRIEAPIPGKNTIGIEIPNPKAEMVGLQGVFETEAFQRSTSPLTIALGVSIEGTPLVTNIQKMPHGLIAGATGSGKSVCINTILISMIYKAHHEDVKFMLIDPKMVELAPYNGIPHLVSPVITDVKAATAALKWAVKEMEDRYEKFVEEGVRDIERYNQKITDQNRLQDKMPYIVIVIDELADLMMVSPQDVEDSISRIAQKARACGIHLLLATQRPSVDVITGLIKANIPTRIAFSVSSQVDSRTILDTSGAEKLLGKGDMLFIENGAGKSIRLQGPFVSDDEVERVTSHARSIAEPVYLFEKEQLLEQAVIDEEEDDLLEEAMQFVLQQNSASTSLLQRHFKIGYNRAARLIDSLENRGIISGQNGSKPREVLISPSQAE
ncbi:DNA translocase FtsK [Virgibacillus xinjiangensis]|uniref:DNA translocase FtsK n=1 Tax=Virgibacillus xinjiangensis TaxID=393090 RepID=A0ABV7CUM3_9BACI